MLRLKVLLQYSYIFYGLLIFAFILAFIRIYLVKYESKYNINETTIVGRITNIDYQPKRYKIEIKSKEKIIANYYLENNIELELGMLIKVKGNLYIPNNNTIPNTFNYKKYLNNNKIFYLMSIDSLEIIKPNNNIIYTIKNYINKRINKYNLTHSYLKALILGDLKGLDEDSYKGYQKNGVVHLFAISGMHINLLATTIFLLLKKLKMKKKVKYILVILLLIIFCLIINTSASVYRSLVFFILLTFSKLFDFNIHPKNILFLTVTGLILINPFIIYNLGFQYSALTTYGLIISSKKNSNYIKNILYTSFMAFLFSLPLTLINFFEVSLLSPLNNLIFGPLITYLIYPLSLLTIVFDFFEPIFYFLLKFMEIINTFLANINTFSMIIPKVNIFFYFLYYFFYSLDSTRTGMF